MRIDLQPAFVLHHRHFRETSVLVDLFTQQYGRISAVARGVRTPRSRWRPLLQPFSPLWVSWQGRGELMTLTAAEASSLPCFLQGDALLSGFYFNELLIRFLLPHDPHPDLFQAYDTSIRALSEQGLQERILRLFEKNMLTELGYGLTLTRTALTHDPLVEDDWYQFYPDQGLMRCEGPEIGDNVFSGRSLLSLAEGVLDDVDSLRTAKKVLRTAIAALPGAKPLHSRRLFNRKEKNL